MPRLQIFDGQDKVRDVELKGGTVTLGRDSANAIVLEDASVSRRHADIEPAGSFFLIRDHGSTNGTFVNDMLVRLHLLSHGDVVRIGRFVLRLDIHGVRANDSTRVRVENFEALQQSFQQESSDSAPEASPAIEWIGEIRSALGLLGDVQDVGDRTIAFLFERFEADHCSLLLREDLDGETVWRSVSARIRDEGEPEDHLQLDAAILDFGVEQFEASIISGAGDTRSSLGLVAPVRAGEETFALYMDRAFSGRVFSEDDRVFVTLVAQQIGLGLRNAALVEEMFNERRKIEAVFSSLTDGVIIADENFRVTQANRAAALIISPDGDTSIIGEDVFGLLGSEQISPCRDVLVDDAREGVAIFSLERGAGEEYGSSRRFLRGEVLRVGVENAHASFVVVIRDATAAWRLERLKREFVTNVAHKLKTPLTVVEADLPLLVSMLEKDSEALEIAEEASRNSDRLRRLVDQFVEFAELELEAEGSSSVSIPCDLARVTAGAIDAAQDLLNDAEVELINQLGDDLPRVIVQPDRIQHALRQLIENAVKFSPKGGRVTISAQPSSSVVRWTVSDEGPGIPAEEIESVFCVGYQIDEEQTGQVPGVGLGLAIAQQILQEHGGDVRIGPNPEGQGTTVTVALPSRSRQGVRESVEREDIVDV